MKRDESQKPGRNAGGEKPPSAPLPPSAGILNRHEFIQDVIKNAGALILGFDRRGNILVASDELRRLTGYDIEDVGASMDQLLQRMFPEPEQLQRFRQINEHLWKGVKIQDLEAQITTKDGRRIFLLINQSRIQDERGEADLAVMVARDITTRKAIEQKLIETTDRLADLNEKLEQANRQLEHANARLNELASTDPLTGLYNRREFQRTFRREFQRMKRDGTPLALAMLDIDHFKALNDTHGHDFGDMVLIEVADLLKTCARETDIVARYGGEEFTVLMPNTGAAEALNASERLCRQMAERAVSDGRHDARVTVSIGVAAVGPEDVPSHEALLRWADEALYAAKARGRNCVVPYGQTGG